MAIKISTGDLLEEHTDAIVNTVNCVGIMGKGIALQFKRKWPANFRAYEAACRTGRMRLGHMFVFDAGGLLKPRYIINFPTKNHWRGKSNLADIEVGLLDLINQVRALDIRSIAIPPLGCGNGGLDWNEVRPLIERAFAKLPNIEVHLYAPAHDHAVRQLAAPESPPKMTPGRAAIIKVLAIYRELSYPLSKIEVQKLAYFLERAGENLRLKFVKHTYGPYSAALGHVLVTMDGTYISGVGDGSETSEIRVIPSALEAAENYLQENNSATLQRVQRVSDAIEGFQTPYGMELLSTVHWVGSSAVRPKSIDEVVTRVHLWNNRKKILMSARDISLAWHRLTDEKWVESFA